MNSFNTHLFLRFNDLSRATPFLHGSASAFATYGVVLFGAALIGALWLARSASDTALASVIWAGLGTLVAVGVNQPLGRLFAEPRPYATHPDTLVLVPRTTDWSFPSDHSVMAGACAMGLLLAARHLPRLRPLAFAVLFGAVLMAVDRVYVGAHYPLDVVAGLGVGAAVSFLGLRMLSRPLHWLTGQMRRVPGIQGLFAPSVAVTPGGADAG